MKKHPLIIAVTLISAAVSTGCVRGPDPTAESVRVALEDLKKRVEVLESGATEAQTSSFIPGLITLGHNPGGHGPCRVQSKFPDTTKTVPGGTVYWLVSNRCNADARLTIYDKTKQNGNVSKEDDPFEREPAATIPKGGLLLIDGEIKSRSKLDPDGKAQKGQKDKWKFRWAVDGQQSDPELEVEY